MSNGKPHTDEALREACLAGDRKAQQQLYQRYFGKLLGIPMRYTRDRAEATALLNQAFLAIFCSLENYRESGSFMGWMSTITFRVTMDHLRFEQRYRERISLETAEPRPQRNQVEAELAAEDIFRYIQKLPDHMRVVFSLHVVDGYKHEEIANMLGITVSNSKWRLSKARETLQSWLGGLYNPQSGKSA